MPEVEFDELTKRLELEAQGLRETIAVSHQRLSEIQIFLELGRKLAGSHALPLTLAKLMSVSSSPYSGKTQRDRILGAAETILSDGRRRTTQELFAELEGFGITPGGADPVQNLSTYLSRSDRFTSDVKRGGWTVRSFAQNFPEATLFSNQLSSCTKSMLDDPTSMSDDSKPMWAFATVPKT